MLWSNAADVNNNKSIIGRISNDKDHSKALGGQTQCMALMPMEPGRGQV